MERTFAIIKPDAVERRLAGKILARIEEAFADAFVRLWRGGAIGRRRQGCVVLDYRIGRVRRSRRKDVRVRVAAQGVFKDQPLLLRELGRVRAGLEIDQ